jgi:Tol biopolymer transport system component
MAKIGVRDAIVIHSESVDEEPVWSPDGRYLAANVDGKWIRIEIDALALEEATWRGGRPVGLVRSKANGSSIEESTVRDWERHARFGPRVVTTRSGTTIELREEDLATRFVITSKGSQPETLWTSSMENCHSLALSPDDRYVAFICELNGVIVATP